jgi:hypothetical protein
MKMGRRVTLFPLVVLAASPAQADEYRVGRGGHSSIQAAIDAALSGPSRNSSGNAVIRVGPGTWRGPTVSGATPNAGGNMGRGYVEIIGSGSKSTRLIDNSVPGSCGSVIATTGAAIILRGLTLEGASSVKCQSAIFAQNNAVVLIGPDVAFGSTPSQHMHAEANGVIEIYSDYRVTGSAYQHWAVSTGGVILVDPKPLKIRFERPVTFDHFAWAQSRGVIMVGANRQGSHVTFVNPQNVRAKFRYAVQSNAVIDMNEGGQPLPGVSAYTASGGQYVNGR